MSNVIPFRATEITTVKQADAFFSKHGIVVLPHGNIRIVSHRRAGDRIQYRYINTRGQRRVGFASVIRVAERMRRNVNLISSAP